MKHATSHRRLHSARRMLNASLALKRRRLRTASAIVRAGALGVLRPPDLDAFVCQTYSSDADFYHPDVRQDTYEQRIVPSLLHLAPGTRLLDAFCGQGREARILSRAGFDVTGIDSLPAMIEGARSFAAKDGFSADFQVADFDTFVDPNGVGYDVVYTSAWMFSTCPTQARRREFLDQCARLCQPQGVIVISYEPIDASRRLQNLILDLTARLSSLCTIGYHAFERGDRLGEAGLFWHLFSRDDALREISAAQLTVVDDDFSTDGLLDFLLLKKASSQAGANRP